MLDKKKKLKVLLKFQKIHNDVKTLTIKQPMLMWKYPTTTFDFTHILATPGLILLIGIFFFAFSISSPSLLFFFFFSFLK
jgi:hypothetical protein